MNFTFVLMVNFTYPIQVMLTASGRELAVYTSPGQRRGTSLAHALSGALGLRSKDAFQLYAGERAHCANTQSDNRRFSNMRGIRPNTMMGVFLASYTEALYHND
ncbi:hypothetical protein GDO81_001073 [Engystomops pustulosus]|uniref:Uncharacterized protein n=1 Tax=Engystomops pustulosus TaxID=76066 RepID=A0AAV7DB10_ENGPU|nr:hypothetical protein GDO81_001073 [Engystomops pustulosus]